ncbi:CDP-diacylglycerol--glycerol-3-phosphate 3-phosphatidyltransferase [Candidatus Latescibacterota bacterium]
MRASNFTLANMLTILRIILVPVYLGFFSRGTWGSVVIALIVFIIAAVTDLYDGRLARQRKEETSLGKFLDPLADKFLVLGALIQFWLMGLVSGWLVGVIVIRDVYVTVMRINAIMKGTELATSGDAKLKTGIQLTVVITTIVFTGGRMIAMTLLPDYNGTWIDINNYIMFYNGLLSVAVIFTIYSWVKYLIPAKN